MTLMQCIYGGIHVANAATIDGSDSVDLWQMRPIRSWLWSVIKHFACSLRAEDRSASERQTTTTIDSQIEFFPVKQVRSRRLDLPTQFGYSHGSSAPKPPKPPPWQLYSPLASHTSFSNEFLGCRSSCDNISILWIQRNIRQSTTSCSGRRTAPADCRGGSERAHDAAGARSKGAFCDCTAHKLGEHLKCCSITIIL